MTQQSFAGVGGGCSASEVVREDVSEVISEQYPTWGMANWKIIWKERSGRSNSKDFESGDNLGCLSSRKETLWLRKGEAEVRSRGVGRTVSCKPLDATVVGLSLAETTAHDALHVTGAKEMFVELTSIGK